MKNGYVLQFDGQHTTAVYRLEDLLMKHNLISDSVAVADSSRFTLHNSFNKMERELKAIIQQYMTRMKQNRLTP